MKGAKESYAQLCARCHGPRGNGKVGPALSGQVWKDRGVTVESIAKVIREGRLEKGMPPWSHVFDKQEAMVLARWLYSLEPGGAQ